MNARKLILSTSALMLITLPSIAQDYRIDAPYMQKVEWNQQQPYGSQANNSNYLQAQINRLERENEQLRAAINRMQQQGAAPQPDYSDLNDTRIQALLEENRRLTTLLNQTNSDSTISSDVFARKIYTLNEQNERLQGELKATKEKALRDRADAERFASENQKLLSQRGNQNLNLVEIASLRSRIAELEKRNSALQLQTANVDNSSKKEILDLQKKENQISALQTSVKRLEKEKAALKTEISKTAGEFETLKLKNNELISKQQNVVAAKNSESLALKEKDQKINELMNALALAKSENEREQTAPIKEKDKKITELMASLTAAKTENQILQDKIDTQIVQQSNQKNNELAALQAQNNSLRETIRAQNEMLVMADNATKKAEELSLENQSLRRKIELAGHANLTNTKSTQELLARHEDQSAELERQRQYINKLEGLKDTVKQLRMENDSLRANTSVTNVSAQISSLEKQATDLRLENQNLKARIDLLSQKTEKQQQTSNDAQILLETKPSNSDVKFEKQGMLSTDEPEDVKVLETSYPKVDKVLPILNEKGGHIYDATKEEQPESIQKDASLAAEDLLKQGPKPLGKK